MVISLDLNSGKCSLALVIPVYMIARVKLYTDFPNHGTDNPNIEPVPNKAININPDGLVNNSAIENDPFSAATKSPKLKS